MISLLDQLAPDFQLFLPHLNYFDARAFPLTSRVKNFSLPPLFQLFLGDVRGGSETPAMVSKVLQFRQKNPETAAEIWNQLTLFNSELEGSCESLCEFAHASPTEYADAVDLLCKLPFSIWKDQADKSQLTAHTADVCALLIELHKTFLAIRAVLRRLSAEVSVPIEPISQTAILDATCILPGCILAGVPGAGGFDAIFCLFLVKGNINDRNQLIMDESFLKNVTDRLDSCWSSQNVVRLKVEREERGVIVEK